MGTNKGERRIIKIKLNIKSKIRFITKNMLIKRKSFITLLPCHPVTLSLFFTFSDPNSSPFLYDENQAGIHLILLQFLPWKEIPFE